MFRFCIVRQEKDNMSIWRPTLPQWAYAHMCMGKKWVEYDLKQKVVGIRLKTESGRNTIGTDPQGHCQSSILYMF